MRVQDNIIHRALKRGSFDVATAETTEALYEICHNFDCRLVFGELIERAVGLGVDFIWQLCKFFQHQNRGRN